MGYLIDLPLFASLGRWRRILADLERIEDKDEAVEDAICTCRREIGRIMGRATSATEAPAAPTPLPATRAFEVPAPVEMRPLDFARRSPRLKED